MTTPARIPFPVVDEVSRHCLQAEEPETVHIEVHLPGPLDPARMRKAFTEALHRHPRILMREAAGGWYRRHYEWELTENPDVEVVSFPAPGRNALRDARTRALSQAPPLSLSPPIRLEVVERAGPEFKRVKGRWVVERTFAWIGRCRRPSKGYEGTIASGAAAVRLAIVHLMARRLVRKLEG